MAACHPFSGTRYEVRSLLRFNAKCAGAGVGVDVVIKHHGLQVLILLQFRAVLLPLPEQGTAPRSPSKPKTSPNSPQTTGVNGFRTILLTQFATRNSGAQRED